MTLKWYPNWDVLACGCKLTMVHEGGKDVAWYHPCSRSCENLAYALDEAQRLGKPWEHRSIDAN